MSEPRVCLIVGDFPVLSETFVSTEAWLLKARVEAARPGGGPAAPAPVDYASADRPFVRRTARRWLLRRHPLRCLADRWGRFRWGREEDVPRLVEIATIARRVAEHGETHLHAHFATGPALTAMRVARLLGLTYSVTAHAWDIFLAPANLREKLEGAAVAFTVCEYNARHLREVAPAAHLEVVVMGVDPERFARRGPLPNGRTVLAVGRLVEKKGFEVLADAADRLDDVRVRIVGDGPLRERLEGRRVELLGERTPAEIADLLQEADVLAMPSIQAADGDRDSMPVVVKEAMAAERMIVASDAFGLPECVHEPWGRLVTPGDAGELAAAIEALLARPPDERAAAGAAGRAWVLEHADVRAETLRIGSAIADAVAS